MGKRRSHRFKTTTGCRQLALILVVVMGSLYSVTTSSQENPPIGYVGAEVSIGQLAEDTFLGLSLQVAFEANVKKIGCHGWLEAKALDDEETCQSRLRLGGEIPLRFKLVDESPESEGVLREEDWDEAAEFMRVLRLVEYGTREDPLYGRAGELSDVVLGHGSIMNHYFNTIDVDHFSLGVNSQLNGDYAGVELLIDSVTSPSVVGGRLHTRPVAMLSKGGMRSWWSRYTLGVTLLLDIDAPLTFERVDATEDLSQPYRVTTERRLVPYESQVTGVLGFDHELRLVETESIDFVPYVDINTHLDGGSGLHLGTMMEVRLTAEAILIPKLELRWQGPQYLPEYFGSLYEVERQAFFGWRGAGDPKLKVMKDQASGAIMGGAGELTLRMKWLELTLGYSDYENSGNSSVLARLKVEQKGSARLGIYYQRLGFDGLDDLFEFNNSLLVTEVRYPIGEWLYLLGQHSRLWRLQERGEYAIVNDWQLGAGSVMSF